MRPTSWCCWRRCSAGAESTIARRSTRRGFAASGWRICAPHDRWARRSSRWCTPSAAAITVAAFIGPALVPLDHPLASLGGTLSGIQLSGRFVSDLFFSGPGAGPDVTAATILDDAVEAVSSGPTLPRAPRRATTPVRLKAAETEWFVRARFPGLVPERASTEQAVRDARPAARGGHRGDEATRVAPSSAAHARGRIARRASRRCGRPIASRPGGSGRCVRSAGAGPRCVHPSRLQVRRCSTPGA